MDDFGTDDAQAIQKPAVLIVPFANRSENIPPIGRLCSPVEEELKQFAGWLSILKKITGYLRKVTTLWASIVILAGFGNFLSPLDFWFSTAVVFLNYRMEILTRKYSNDEEQEDRSTTRHQKPTACLSKMTKFRGDMYDKLSPKLFPLLRIIIMSIMIIKFAGAVCLLIILNSKAAKDFYSEQVSDNDTHALLLFYVLVICECAFFLVGDAYYLCSVYCCRQLHRLSMELGLGCSNLELIQGFLNDSIASSNLGRDMATYGVELLASDSKYKQFMGAQILRSFLTKFPKDFSGEVLVNIGANFSAIKTLVEMTKLRRGGLKYRKEQGEEEEDDDKEIEKAKESAILILAHLAKESENPPKIATILGSMRAISDLFEWDCQASRVCAIDLGLRIIEEMAHDQGDREKIGKTKDFLDKLVSLTKESSYEANAFQERSLQVLKLLTSPKGSTWKIFRREVSETTTLIDNIRDMLSPAGKTKLQKLGMDVLSNLAAEKHANERIGDNPGVLEALVEIFFRNNEDEELTNCAGKALLQLVQKSKGNCLRILRLNLNESFVFALDRSFGRFRLHAAQVLLYLCINGGENKLLRSLLESTLQIVLKGIVDEDVKVQDVMVGIAAFGFNLCDSAVICNATLARKLQQILTRHKYEVSTKHPNVCNAVVEVVLWMIKIDAGSVNVFKEVGISKELQEILESTPKIEEALAHLV